jgi:hypothetical protein
MSTNLPANLESLSARELMELTGQKQAQLGLGVPSLRVNYDDEDDDGNKIPRGQWFLAKDGIHVYAETVTFQPMFKTLQYSHYNNDEQKMVATSVHFQNFSDEVPDDAGGFKCGKVNKKQLEQLTDAEKKVQKDIKLSQVFFGLVTIEGVNQKGKPAKHENVPAVFYAKGSHYMPMSELLEKLSKSNTLMQTVVLKLGLKREKNGGVTYWEVVPSIEKDVAVNGETFALVRQFAETVKAENDTIMDKWRKNKDKRNVEQAQKAAVDKLGLGDGSDLGKDFE